MRIIAVTLLALGLALAACPAWAHGVGAYAYAEGGQLKGEAYFAGGGRCRSCRVEVLDAQGAALTETETDAEGAFAMAMPSGELPWTVVVHAGEGHRADYKVTAADLGQPMHPAGEAASPEPKGPPGPPPAPGPVTAAVHEAEFGKLLDKKLAPLQAQVRRLAEAQGQVTLRDVVGGLGWILGLVGVLAWAKARPRGQGR